MTITMFGANMCPNCKSAKRELKRRGLLYEYVDLSDEETPLKFREDWRQGHWVDLQAALAYYDSELPLLKLDDNEIMSAEETFELLDDMTELEAEEEEINEAVLVA